MPVVLGNNVIQGVDSIANTGTTYGITIDSTGRVKLPFRPRFYAYGIRDTPSSSTFVRFGTVPINVGGVYNTDTGRFTAPIAGVYCFWFSNIGSNSPSTVWRQNIRINGGGDIFQFRNPTTAAGSAYATNSAGFYSVSLNANDFITTFITSDTGSVYYPGGPSAGNDYWYFSGWLVE